ncbi:hypothetical protein ABN763_18850, partial [Spongiivirga sp. MCCC 1A20706]|uniref:beta strand repeat-containing protein n=1 Tax=Spongiivirga sp. MCCC 1A20706 TaxID=3160963 RepID=UPI003977BBE4
MRKQLLFSLLFCAVSWCYGQITLIPDANFEQELITQGIDSDNTVNGQVFTADIASVTNLDVSNKNISDLTGIEDFTSMIVFNASSNTGIQLADFNGLISLRDLDMDDCTMLSNIVLPVNGNLEDLELRRTNISNIDLSSVPNLEQLFLSETQISTIDLGNVPALNTLVVNQTGISSLNTTSLPSLAALNVDDTTNFTGNFDLRQNTILSLFSCSRTGLSTLDLRNGNNANILTMNAFSNPNLTCIAVDDPNNIPASWQIGATTSYASVCTSQPITLIPDVNFEQALITRGVDTDGVINGQIFTADALATSGALDLIGFNINNLTGIEAFENLEVLIAIGNPLAGSLDFTNLTAIQQIFINGSGLEFLNVSGLSNLEFLNIAATGIKDIDLSTNSNLEIFDANNSSLRSVIWPNNTANLSGINVTSTDVEVLDLEDYFNNAGVFRSLFATDCPNLEFVSVKSVANAVDVSQSPNLSCLQVDDVTVANQKIAGNSWTVDTGLTVSTNCGAAPVTANITVPQNPVNPVTVTIDFNEAVTGLALTDFTVPANVVLSNLSGSGSSYSFTITGTFTTCTETVNITLPANSVTSVATTEPNSTISRTLQLLENQPPTVVTQNFTLQLDTNGQGSITVNDIDNGTADNCTPASDLTFTLSTANFDCSNIGPNTVTLTVTDDNGNTDSATAIVTVEDNVAPVIATLNITRQLDTNGSVSITLSDVGFPTDNCVVATQSIDITNFDCSNIGPNTVTITATDSSGNTTTETATVTIEDNIAPNAISQNFTLQLNANGQATLTGNDIDGGSSDNCALVSVVPSKTAFDCTDLGVNSVDLVVTDVNGNVSTATATVTVQDSPFTAIAQDITVALSPLGQFTIIPEDIDNGSGSGCITNPTLSLDVTNFDCSNIGPNTVTLTATSGGNTDTATAIVTVEDTIPPTAIAVNVTVALDNNGLGSITPADIDGGSTDNCAVQSTAISQGNFDCSNIGANNITLTVTDISGNISTANAVVTVVDNVFPNAITQNTTIQLNASGQATLSGNDIDGGSNDNCGLASVVPSQTTFTCNDLGQNTVDLIVTDVNGNVSTAQATVTVNEQPLTAIAQDITVQLDTNGQATVTPQDIDNGSGSGCTTSPALSLDITDFDCSDIGSPVTVTLTATVGGNSVTDTAVVTVVDSVQPNLLLQDTTLQLDTNGTATLLQSDVVTSVTDNCSVASTTLSTTSFDCSNLGPNEVVVTVTDGSGNTTNFSTTVTVVDNIAPLAIAQDITVQLAANGQVSITGSDVNNGSFDNCGVNVSVSPSTFDCSNLGANTVTLTVTDPSGNTDTATAVVTVEDNQPLTAIAQDITVQLDVNGQATITPQDVDNGSGSGCGNISLSLDTTTFDCSNIGQNTVTLTVTEGPNTETATAIVTVEDTIPPSVIPQVITVQLDSNGQASITPNDIDNGSADNCGIATRT